MIVIEYSKSGEPLSDFAVEGWTKLIVRDQHKYKLLDYAFSTSLIFTALRLEVVKGNIAPDNIKFVYAGKDIFINKYGAIIDWPNGFCDSHHIVSGEIISHSMARAKEEERSP